jgi:hypothetical protein
MRHSILLTLRSIDNFILNFTENSNFRTKFTICINYNQSLHTKIATNSNSPSTYLRKALTTTTTSIIGTTKVADLTKRVISLITIISSRSLTLAIILHQTLYKLNSYLLQASLASNNNHINPRDNL